MVNIVAVFAATCKAEIVGETADVVGCPSADAFLRGLDEPLTDGMTGSFVFFLPFAITTTLLVPLFLAGTSRAA